MKRETKQQRNKGRRLAYDYYIEVPGRQIWRVDHQTPVGGGFLAYGEKSLYEQKLLPCGNFRVTLYQGHFGNNYVKRGQSAMSLEELDSISRALVEDTTGERAKKLAKTYQNRNVSFFEGKPPMKLWNSQEEISRRANSEMEKLYG